jgi:hypothetical protein
MVIGEERDDTKTVDAGSAYIFELQGSSSPLKKPTFRRYLG